MTDPAENATLSPPFRFLRQALAVLEFAAVAIFMPINPDRAEKNPPVIKAYGAKRFIYPKSETVSRRTNMRIKNAPTTRYCLLR